MDFRKLNVEFKQKFELDMRHLFDTEFENVDDELKDFYSAMAYSLFAGGKRIRPMIMINTYEKLGGKNNDLILNFAYAIELIHTYSLVHDDLPAMDNDDYRRGKLTSHKKFGEDIAILVGDALLNKAFEVMLRSSELKNIDSYKVLRAMSEMANNSGASGMVGGQAVEILSDNPSEERILYIENLKTSKLFVSSLVCAAILAGASDDVVERFRNYGKYIGLAFQIKDDLMDMGTEDKGMVANSSNTTADSAVSVANALVSKALLELDGLDVDKEYFSALADYMISRTT